MNNKRQLTQQNTDKIPNKKRNYEHIAHQVNTKKKIHKDKKKEIPRKEKHKGKDLQDVNTI